METYNKRHITHCLNKLYDAKHENDVFLEGLIKLCKDLDILDEGFLSDLIKEKVNQTKQTK